MRAGRSDCVTCKTVSLGGAGSYESDFARLNNSSISCVHEMQSSLSVKSKMSQ